MIAGRVQALLNAEALAEADECYLRSRALILTEDYPQAIALLSRAVQLHSRHTDWRYQLALLLRREDRLDEARHQAKICVRLEPARQEYCELLREINRTILSR